MREIKFRGKHKNPYGDKWVYGYYAMKDGGHVIVMPHADAYIGSLNEKKPIPAISVEHIIDVNTLGQYAGLHDKNGKEIYEGDIVRDMEVYLTHQSYVKQKIESVQEAEKYRYFGNVAVVEFCTQEIASCGCCYQEFVGTGFKAKRVDLTCCEVIGNIWEDSDLLNESKNTETN